MKHLPLTICFLQLVSYSACQEIYASNCNHMDERQLLAEITGLRQLVIQESLCRQELERQIRELRQLLLHDESITGTDRSWNMSLSSDTGLVTEKLDRITRLIESKITRIEGNISQVFSAVKKQEIQIESIKETYLNLSLNIQELNVFLKGNGCSSSENINLTNDDDDKVRETQTTNPGATIDITPMTESDSNNVFTTRDDSAVRQDNRGHMGKSFAIMVPSASTTRTTPINLIISTESNTQITIRSSYPGLSRVYNVTSPGINLTLPADFQLRRTGGAIVQSRGIILDSTKYVSVYVFHYDGYFALPARLFGTNYQSFTAFYSYSFLSIMPYGGCATVHLTSSSGVSNQTVYIPELSVYYFYSASSLQNVMISSNQTIALVSGHYSAYSTNQAIYDSILPIHSWNTSYIIPNIQNSTHQYDNFYSSKVTNITAMRNFQTTNDTITLSYRSIRSDSFVSNFVQSQNGSFASVILMYRGTVINSFLCVVPSLSHYSNNYRFWTPYYASTNYLIAIIKEEDRNGLLIDNSPITNPYMIHSVCTLNRETYRILTIVVTEGWHVVKHNNPDVRFGLLMYGGDRYKSYGLSLGLRLD